MTRLETAMLAASTLTTLLGLLLGAHQVGCVNPVLDLRNLYPYLINNVTGAITEPRDYMDFDIIYKPNETYWSGHNAAKRTYDIVKAFDFANYYQSDYFRYSSEQDLSVSAHPIANERKCSQQLTWLESKLNQSHELLYASGREHSNLMNLLDSLGRPGPATSQGNNLWVGSYYQCSRVTIDMGEYDREQACQEASKGNKQAAASCLLRKLPSSRQDQEQHQDRASIKTRYCMGKLRDVEWPNANEDNYQPTITYKMGLCLPEVCDTSSIRRHKRQIELLSRFVMPDHWKSRLYLHDLYCSPDERSPLRQLSPPARVFLSLCSAWLVLLCAATATFSCYKRHERKLRAMVASVSTSGDSTATTNNNNASFNMDEQQQHQLIHQDLKSNHNNNSNDHKPFLHELPQNRNRNQSEQQQVLRSEGSMASLSSWLHESPAMIRILKALSISESMSEFCSAPSCLADPEANRWIKINLNVLDCIKVMCCVLVVLAHIVFIHMQHLINIVEVIEFSNGILPRVLISFFNLVDTFFIISALLTTYFIFKRFNKSTFANPLIWLYISLLRLLRLSPVYLLIFWYTKTLSVYIASGPIWDYGTDKSSLKGLCINDNWWKSVLYFGNANTMQPLCNLPAWSIIVDSQYSLVLPPVLFLILKHKRAGYVTLLAAVILSTCKMSYQLITQTAVKESDMGRVRLHVYPLISRFATEFYNDPWNRLSPVAVGIIGGHLLYNYDVGKLKRWPWFMRGFAFKLTLLMHVVIFAMPSMSLVTNSPDDVIVEVNEPARANEQNTIIFVLSNATMKPVWSIVNTILLLRLISDLRFASSIASLMAHNIWHCLGRLCFTAYLVHYEVIITLLKSRQEGIIDGNWSNVGRDFSLVLLISIVLSYLIYILFEAPINKLISLAMDKPAKPEPRVIIASQQQQQLDNQVNHQTVLLHSFKQAAEMPKPNGKIYDNMSHDHRHDHEKHQQHQQQHRDQEQQDTNNNIEILR